MRNHGKIGLIVSWVEVTDDNRVGYHQSTLQPCIGGWPQTEDKKLLSGIELDKVIQTFLAVIIMRRKASCW